MQKGTLALTQFNGGLATPQMEARTDLQMYPYCSRQQDNAMSTLFGSIRNRGGSVYVKAGTDIAAHWGSWTDVNTIPFYYLESNNETMAYGKGIYVYLDPVSGKIYSSVDGLNWTLRTTITTIGTSLKSKMIYCSALSMFAIAWGDYIIYSYNGITWQQSAHGKTLGSYLNLATDGTKIILITGLSVYQSTNGLTYTTAGSLPFYCVELTYQNGYFIACSGSANLYYSTNALSWSTSSISNPKQCAYGNGYYYVITTTSIWRAAALNGSWTSITYDVDKNWTKLKFLQDTFFVFDAAAVKTYKFKAIDISDLAEDSATFKFTGKAGSLLYGESSTYNKLGIKKYYAAAEPIVMENAINIPFNAPGNIGYQLEFGDYYIKFYKNHQVITHEVSGETEAYTLATPYAVADLKNSDGICTMGFYQSADVLYLTHEKYPTKKLMRYGDANWVLADYKFNGGPWQEMNTDKDSTITASAKTGNADLTATKDIFTADMVGQLIRLHMQGVTVKYWVAGEAISTAGEIRKSDGKFYYAATSGTTGTVKPTHTEGTEYDGSKDWTYKHSGYGWGRIHTFTDSKHVTIEVLSELPQTTATYKWEISLVGANGIYPSRVSSFKDRIIMGINAKSGPRLITSVTGDYENYQDLIFGEILAESAINLPLLVDVNQICWLLPQDNLYVGMAGCILSVHTLTTTDPFGPNNITYDRISEQGSSILQPLCVGESTLYTDVMNKKIYDIQYDMGKDKYLPNDISFIAEKYLSKGIKSWAYQSNTKIIFMVMQDGTLLGLTYETQQQVRAFHRHVTDGIYENLIKLRAPDGSGDEIWAIVKRTINGTAIRYMEYFSNGIPLNIPANLTTAQELDYILKNCLFLDCAKEYQFETPTATLTGLSHLEGCTVSAVADGVVVKNLTVSSGAVNLPSAASKVKIGLPYSTVFEPMPPHIEMQDGSGNGRSQRVNEVIARIHACAPFKYGNDINNLKTASFTGLKSGDIKLVWPAGNTEAKLQDNFIVNSTGARIIFVQEDPLPFMLNALFLKIEVAND